MVQQHLIYGALIA